MHSNEPRNYIIIIVQFLLAAPYKLKQFEESKSLGFF